MVRKSKAEKNREELRKLGWRKDVIEALYKWEKMMEGNRDYKLRG